MSVVRVTALIFLPDMTPEELRAETSLSEMGRTIEHAIESHFVFCPSGVEIVDVVVADSAEVFERAGATP